MRAAPALRPASSSGRIPSPLLGLPEKCVGRAHLLAPVEEALALGPYVEQRPLPRSRSSSIVASRHVLGRWRLQPSMVRTWIHISAPEKGPAPLCLPLRLGAAPRPARRFPWRLWLSVPPASARTSGIARPGRPGRCGILDRAPAQQSWRGKTKPVGSSAAACSSPRSQIGNSLSAAARSVYL